MPTLKQIIEENDTGAGRAFDLVIQALIVLSLVTFSIETLPDLSAASRRFLRAIEVLTVIIFTIEYVLRIFLADNKVAFITSFFGIIDLLAILPFYVVLWVGSPLDTGISIAATVPHLQVGSL